LFRDQLKPKIVESLSGLRVEIIAGGWRHSMAAASDGKLYGWGWNKVRDLLYGWGCIKVWGQAVCMGLYRKLYGNAAFHPFWVQVSFAPDFFSRPFHCKFLLSQATFKHQTPITTPVLPSCTDIAVWSYIAASDTHDNSCSPFLH
jgi:hypothetical protein